MIRFSIRRASCAALLAASVFAASALPAAAPAYADAGETQVHVALFVKTNTYSAAAGAVTLSAEGGLAVSDASGAELFRTADAASVRMTFDGYRVVVAETGDAAAAAALEQEVRRASQPAAVFERTVSGRPLYAVEAGPYGGKAEAEAARTALAGSAALSARLGGAAMTLRGPHYARASSHATEAEALSAAAALWDAGIYAVPVLTSGAGGVVRCELWIGGTADDASLQRSVDAAAAAVPGLAAAPVAQTVQYAAIRSDRAADGGALGSAIRHAAVGGDGAKLSAAPVLEASAVRVAERFGRSYRGAIDVFAHNGALAAVNRVDLESYVASVIGAELGTAWPAEALKAQAVAARTYVLKQGWKYGVANVADSTSDQAYQGVEREYPDVVAAADATAGERLTLPDGSLLDAFYHSNGGGRTADPSEVWGAPIPGIASTPSPDDAAERNKLEWYRVVLPDDRVGYVRSDYVELTGAANEAGFPKAVAAGDAVNVRAAPYVDDAANPAIANVAAGSALTVIDAVTESTAYQWIRGPVKADRLKQQLAASGAVSGGAASPGDVRSIEVTERGDASGRVTGMSVNGVPVAVGRPEQYRTLFGLPSNRFEVEQTAAVDVLGADGRSTSLADTSGASALSVVSSGGGAAPLAAEQYLITDGSGAARVATRSPEFRFVGSGYGHGLGMSQWGAYGLAELGYDYRKILLYYYKDATITKE